MTPHPRQGTFDSSLAGVSPHLFTQMPVVPQETQTMEIGLESLGECGWGIKRKEGKTTGKRTIERSRSRKEEAGCYRQVIISLKFDAHGCRCIHQHLVLVL